MHNQNILHRVIVKRKLMSRYKVLRACIWHPGIPKCVLAIVSVADLPGPQAELVLITRLLVWVNVNAYDVITSLDTMLLLPGCCVTFGKCLYLSEFIFAHWKSGQEDIKF